MPQNDDGSITLEYLRMNKYIYISSIWAPCLQTLTCAFMLLKGKNAPQAHFTGIAVHYFQTFWIGIHSGA